MGWLGTMMVATSILANPGPPGSDDPRPGTPDERLAKIAGDQEETSRIYHRDYDAAKDDDERTRALKAFHEAVSTQCDRALDLAREFPRGPFARRALIFVITKARAGPGDESARAIEILLRDHVRDDGMVEVCARVAPFFHWPAAEALIRAVASVNPDETTRGIAREILADYLIEKAKRIRTLRANPGEVASYEESRGRDNIARVLRESPDELEAEAKSVLREVIATPGTVRSGKRSLAETARGKLLTLEGLRVGDVAPEIDGVDADGHRFKLSDHRGKVVLLTFSGEWCGPCRAFYPRERAIVARLKDAPFVALCVNTDEKVETLRKAIASGEITWRCWWDGEDAGGPITVGWGIQTFPTSFLIDAEGVIRRRSNREEGLEAELDALIARTRAEGPKP